MPDAPPELAYESVVDLLGHSLTVAGRTTDGAFIVPLVLVGVSTPSATNRYTAFTADLVGPVGTRLTAPGRYLVLDGGHRFSLTLSWVTRHLDEVHYLATFVHRIHRLPVEAGQRAIVQPVSGRAQRRGHPALSTITQAASDLSSLTGTAVSRGSRSRRPAPRGRTRLAASSLAGACGGPHD